MELEREQLYAAERAGILGTGQADRLGLAIIAAGIAWNRQENAIYARLRIRRDRLSPPP